MKKEYVAYVVSWTESEAGWGCRPDGYTLHESQEDVTAYIAAHWEREKEYNRKHGIVGVPECYSRPDRHRGLLTPITEEAAKALTEATGAGKHGVWLQKQSEFAVKV